ncbi:unnamed protein product [Spirodela intermedia]|uniref:non-specific serine/threonine protein kinase n=1 Tax=Spirodela intermedia TaxID=51605 RepID=A0A7I8JTE3_SPIIN|nr:unnamed protein product [Spirodela intermedia]CAA6672712.1 unnamed protein product [Spirodela intermedia]
MAAGSDDLPFETVEIGERVYKLGNNLGNGRFGRVYEGSYQAAAAGVDTATGERVIVAVKVQKMSDDKGLPEGKVYEDLGGIHGLPRIHGYGKKAGYSFLVMDLLGRNLAQVKAEQSGIPRETVMRVAVKAISILEEVHSRKYIHGDVKPENLLLGSNDPNEPLLFLVDFGLAARWEYGTGSHVEYNQQLGFSGGTVRYASVNAHLGRTLSRRDDLESLAYSLAFLLQEKLPWQGKRRRKNTSSSAKRRRKPSRSLFASYPEFTKFFGYAVNLGFDEEPDYKNCKSFFQERIGVNDSQMDSRDDHCPLTKQLRTGRPAAQWVTVYDPWLPTKQRCHYNVPEEFLPQFIARDKEQKLFISSVASCDGKWALIADAGTGFQSQVYHISPEFLPKVFYITAVAGSREGKSLVVMSRGNKHSKQEYVDSNLFPSSWVDKNLKANYVVTSMATSRGRWAVVMSVDSTITEQVIELDFAFPSEGVRRRWAAGYRITAVAATMEQVAVEQQDKDFYVASVCYGRTAS